MSPTPQQPTYIPPLQSVWSGFYRKALKERQHQLKLFFPHLFAQPVNSPTSSAKAHTITRTSNAPRASCSASSVPAHDLLEATAVFPQIADVALPTLEAADAISIHVLAKKEDVPFPIRGLDVHVADNMVENCIGYVFLASKPEDGSTLRALHVSACGLFVHTVNPT